MPSVLAKDKKYLGRDGPAAPLQVIRQKGSFAYDDRGKRYIDFYMGWCVGNIGWGRTDVLNVLKKYKGPTYVAPKYLYAEWAELAELFAKIAPGKLIKSHRATGGTEAVEIALQAAMAHTKRSKFVSVEGSYHGHSIGAMSVGDSAFRDWYSNLLPNCYKISGPLDAVAGRKVEEHLSHGEVAAYISEPVICNAGVIIPTQEYWDIVQQACKKYGTVLIIDEVATGFGRTGKMFASEHYDIKPDIMCIAKGATGGFGTLGATLMTDEIAKSFEFGFNFYSTFGWHPLNVALTLANIKVLLKNKTKLLKNAIILGKYFEQRLQTMPFQNLVAIRKVGLAIGLEFKDASDVSEIENKALNKGLLIANATSKTLVFFPALDIDIKTAKEGLDILEQCL